MHRGIYGCFAAEAKSGAGHCDKLERCSGPYALLQRPPCAACDALHVRGVCKERSSGAGGARTPFALGAGRRGERRSIVGSCVAPRDRHRPEAPRAPGADLDCRVKWMAGRPQLLPLLDPSASMPVAGMLFHLSIARGAGSDRVGAQLGAPIPEPRSPAPTGEEHDTPVEDDFDIWRDSAARYLGYANEVRARRSGRGRPFQAVAAPPPGSSPTLRVPARRVVPPYCCASGGTCHCRTAEPCCGWDGKRLTTSLPLYRRGSAEQKPSYGVSFAYVFVDTYDKRQRALKVRDPGRPPVVACPVTTAQPCICAGREGPRDEACSACQRCDCGHTGVAVFGSWAGCFPASTPPPPSPFPQASVIVPGYTIKAAVRAAACAAGLARLPRTHSGVCGAGGVHDEANHAAQRLDTRPFPEDGVPAVDAAVAAHRFWAQSHSLHRHPDRQGRALPPGRHPPPGAGQGCRGRGGGDVD